MLALCSMISGTYYAHYYASAIGGSLSSSAALEVLVTDFQVIVLHTHLRGLWACPTMQEIFEIMNSEIEFCNNFHQKINMC